jgi:hypothetical protein
MKNKTVLTNENYLIANDVTIPQSLNMTQRTTHEIKAEVQGLLHQIGLALAEIDSPEVTICDVEGTGIITHPRSAYLGCVKDVCKAMLQDDKTAEIIVSRCA